MPIWFDPSVSLESIREVGKGTMGEHIGMEWVAVGDDFLQAKLPVDHRTVQPFGILHGGASCVLAETLGSFASWLVSDPSKVHCVGIEINANHIRMAKEGFVTGTAKPLHLGAATHVWDIRITDEKGKLVCVSRLTVALIPRKD